MSRFDYIKYDAQAIAEQDIAKQKVRELETLILNIDTERGVGRAQSLAITKLEEAYMWIGKAIRDSQVYRNKNTELQEERDNI